MFAPKSTLTSSFLRLLCAVALLTWTARPSLAQGQTTHTAADFESARTTAETALANARKALRQNALLRATAEDAATRLTTLAQSRDAGSTAVQNLSDINSVLQTLVLPASATTITTALTQAAASLNDSKTGVTSNQTQLTSLKGSDDFRAMDPDLQNRFSQTLLDCGTVLDQISKDDGLNSDSNSRLKAALGKVLTQAIAVTDGFTKAIKPLTDLGDVTPPGTDDQKKAVLKTTGKYLPVYADIVCTKKRYSDQWTGVSTNLKTLDSSMDLSPVQTNLGKFDQDPVSKIPTFLPHWLEVVKQMPSAETVKLEQLIVAVDSDAPANTASAVAELQTANTLQDSFKGVADSWTKLLSSNDCLGGAGALSSDTVTASLAAFGKDSRAMFGALSRLQEGIGGDFSKFITDRVELYYSKDIPGLVKWLNPAGYEEGGTEAAREKANALRQKLSQAEVDLAAAQAEINTYQTRLMQLPEELKQARADAREQDQAYGKTANRLAILNEKLSSATTALQTANSAATAAPADKTAQQAAQRAQQDKDRLTTQTADAQRDNANAQHDKDIADQKLKSAEDEQTGIPAQMEKAKLALQAAQDNVGKRRQESLLAAEAESEAFAASRDVPTRWFAPADGSSKDPARRVEIRGTTGSNVLELRGKKDDVGVVEDMIALIDQPQPQARLTLWSLQLNYTTSKGTINKVNEALKEVEERLAMIRTRMAASVSLLRDAVNASVNKATQESDCKTAAECRLARILHTYDSQVLLQLGLNPAHPEEFATVSRWTAPDPAGTATLGEALMILSLAKPNIRKEAFNSFLDQVSNTAANRKWSQWHGEDRPKHGETKSSGDWKLRFPNTQRALNLDQAPTAGEKNEFTSTQQVVAEALLATSFSRLAKYVDYLLSQIRPKESALVSQCAEIAPINLALRKDPPVPCESYPAPKTPTVPLATAPGLAAQRQALLDQIYATEADLKSLSANLAPTMWYLWQYYGRPPSSFEKMGGVGKFSSKVDSDPQSRSTMIKEGSRTSVSLRSSIDTATTLEAKADEILKRIMTGMEEDLDENFIRPGLADLRADIAGQGQLQVGVIQRTSILATNRLVARVDARSSAQLALGDQQDILQSVTQLAQIYMAAQTGGAIGTLNALNNLKSQTKEPPQEIYGITTGSTFQVTPIFDPSGQALRFNFDYVAANNVTEPNGTMNPQLPRIERHTINTEVQISNLELREISRYEANSKLGLPTKYWGGLPLFKDLLEPYPNVRRWVPLIGWFVRKGGSAAEAQESLLFGQTTTYPTISDIMRSMTESVTVPQGTQDQ